MRSASRTDIPCSTTIRAARSTAAEEPRASRARACVGHRRAVAAHEITDLTLCHGEVVDEAPIAFGFVDRRQGVALEVLHQRKSQHRAIVDVSDDRPDTLPPQLLRCSHSTLTRNQLVGVVVVRADNDRLE
jgi:hypothetical protein